MTHFNAVEILNVVATIRRDVLDSQSACRTAFARDLHGKLLDQLAAMDAALDHEIDLAQKMASTAATPFDLDVIHFYKVCTSFEHDWIKDGPVSLLDPIHELIVAEGEACSVGLAYTEVPAAELEGLAGIMDMIARDTGVRFVAARV